jgi:hypothetical protein
MPSRSKNSPPSGRLTLRITSGREASPLTKTSAALSAPSGVLASMTAMIWSIRCGKASWSIFSCCRHASELDRSSLLSVMMAKCRVK